MTLDPADSVRTSGEEFSRDDGMVFGRTAMSRRLLFRYILIFLSFFAEIRPVLPSISEKVSASSSLTLRIAAPVARDGYSNVIFRSNRPAKADSSTYAGYRPHSQPCVRPLQIPILLPSPPVYLIPVLYCLDRSLRLHPGTGGGVLNSMTVTGLFFGVPARR
ncbi:hypothetical protein C8J57DRAFT_1372198 [Mycena rebaudengoi]|nr:hypothetical protein C8J57DRAFT_1372198 [Mycena rebaudengoi]